MRAGAESSLRKIWDILMPFVVYFIAHDMAQVLLAFLVGLSLGMGEDYAAYVTAHAQTVSGIMNALSLVIGMAFVWPMAKRELYYAKARKEVSPDQSVENRRRTITAYALLAIFAITLALGSNLLLMLTGVTGSSSAYSDVAARQYGVSFVVGAVIYGIISPVAEEIVFRGLIYNRMKRYFGRILSIIVCGILFGVYHGNLVQGIYGTILGIAITFAYEWYGSFTAPVLFHGLANLSVFSISYRQEWVSAMATVANCAIFLIISLISLFFIVRIRKQEGSYPFFPL